MTAGISARHATLLVMGLFLAQPVHLGLWLSRIAEVQATLTLTKAQLALALLGMPCGLLPSLYFAGRTVERIGPRSALLWAFPPMLLAGVLPGLAFDVPSLFAALVALGAVIAFTEVGLNVIAARAEKTHGIQIMNRAHGFWSLGIVAGSLLGVQFSAFDIPAGRALVLTANGLLPLLMITAFLQPDSRPRPNRDEPARPLPPIPPALFPIVLVVFGGTIVEGAMNDWATVYMREADWISAYDDGLALTVFASMVTAGRFMGDSLNRRLGPAWLARICLSAAIAGLGVLVLSDQVWMAFVGFALVGFGVSTIFPLGVSASAGLESAGEARNVSVMTFGALSGFLIGPPLIGYVADLSSLNLALALLIPALLLSLLLAHRLGRG